MAYIVVKSLVNGLREVPGISAYHGPFLSRDEAERWAEKKSAALGWVGFTVKVVKLCSLEEDE